MAAKKKKTTRSTTIKVKKVSPRRLIFYFNIVLAVGIIALTTYSFTKGENIFLRPFEQDVLSEQAIPTPTPTNTPTPTPIQ